MNSSNIKTTNGKPFGKGEKSLLGDTFLKELQEAGEEEGKPKVVEEADASALLN